MDTRARIAWNLRNIRVSQKVTQENLAVDAQVDRTVISDLERGKHNASIDLMDRLAIALLIDISEFFAEPSPSDGKPEPMRAGRKPKP
ncbi:helix-turn-helix domain-containing protein [Rhizobium ruizarguesonis]|jgi:transcriptional regulator with XRE-family HTH domain|uniref:Helix-turn-helix domain-containing protein n=1 Tax=Rhizobium ruizarguesonis TaxID=2081791 RepID=A0AAE4YUK1_9HYPH|nr:helix-turn-helix transcriptional regulator [Rhizobium ruizarguesonis]MBY5833987.1 helix-turn-helix transcriptional regulator [Rhizobium leguminosarum]NKK54375.1 helix-turn-helix domain-containing protein [Rhizobium leguminosarum bv. viciae]MBY5855222.1 helix-turn-helix transcriptional regulator [Rhizobium leguminosarum]MBY5862332.1 helix-turn-helix transcriptional regulator [Rhizobium leguminosarum]MBY5871427.1 helix-turn-helix transcriptional regulator [Rhizobium leguminosarum]